jgi:tRNA threonylcarbamoyl adenosine modification protein (Sua5/YciO/YrdC/YwlC family)
MSQYFTVHPSHPQRRLLVRAAEIIAAGGVIVYPTDTAYALGCRLGDKQSLERIRQIRRLNDKHHFTLTCRDLSEISLYARVNDANYRILKHLTPGPFTFILTATREVPRRLVHAKRKTIGLRVPDNVIALELLEILGEPMMTTTMRFPDQDVPYTDPEDLRARLEQTVDLIVAGGSGEIEPTTVVDLTGAVPEVTRQGLGVFE